MICSCGSEVPPKNFCDFVECLNGATCDGEACQCPLGYEGIDCAFQKDPKKIEIKAVTISDFSATNINGEEWDHDPEELFPAFPDNGFPDIYIIVSNSTGIIYNKTNPNVLNVEPGMDVSLQLANNILITDINSPHKISIMDFDKGGSSQLIELVTFDPYVSDNGFPAEIEIENNGVSLNLTCNYSF